MADFFWMPCQTGQIFLFQRKTISDLRTMHRRINWYHSWNTYCFFLGLSQIWDCFGDDDSTDFWRISAEADILWKRKYPQADNRNLIWNRIYLCIFISPPILYLDCRHDLEDVWRRSCFCRAYDKIPWRLTIIDAFPHTRNNGRNCCKSCSSSFFIWK